MASLVGYAHAFEYDNRMSFVEARTTDIVVVLMASNLLAATSKPSYTQHIRLYK